MLAHKFQQLNVTFKPLSSFSFLHNIQPAPCGPRPGDRARQQPQFKTREQSDYRLLVQMVDCGLHLGYGFCNGDCKTVSGGELRVIGQIIPKNSARYSTSMMPPLLIVPHPSLSLLAHRVKQNREPLCHLKPADIVYNHLPIFSRCYKTEHFASTVGISLVLYC